MKKKCLTLTLALALVLSLGVTAFAAEGTKTYSFNITAISQEQWDGARKEILLHVTQGGETRDITIPAVTEGMGHAVLTGLPVYENGEKTDCALGITLVPVRLLSESLGIPIDWNSEKGAVEFDTYKGHISIPLGATSITMPDGSAWRETTYTYPDGSPIQLAMMRDQEYRTYLPIRAFSSIAFEESRWDWQDTARLEGWITIPETNSKVEWTEEQKELLGYVWDIGSTGNIQYLPHTAKVLEETDASIMGGGDGLKIIPEDIVTNNGIFIRSGDNGELWIGGLHNFIGMEPEVKDQDYLKILKAVLLDVVPDESDALAIGETFEKMHEYALISHGKTNGTDAEIDAAAQALEELETHKEYNSVNIEWHDDWMGYYLSIKKK